MPEYSGVFFFVKSCQSRTIPLQDKTDIKYTAMFGVIVFIALIVMVLDEMTGGKRKW